MASSFSSIVFESVTKDLAKLRMHISQVETALAHLPAGYDKAAIAAKLETAYLVEKKMVELLDDLRNLKE